MDTTIANRRGKILLIAAGIGILILTFATCATFASVASLMNFGDPTATPYIVITGTVEQIAGMPVPAGAVIKEQALRSSGGTFDYTTTLRPRQLYEFYYGYLTQRGIWRAGTRPIITENSAEFQFTALVPRLTIVTVNCDATICNVHVDY